MTTKAHRHRYVINRPLVHVLYGLQKVYPYKTAGNDSRTPARRECQAALEPRRPFQSLSDSSVRSTVSPHVTFARMSEPSRLISVRSITSSSTLGPAFGDLGSVFALFRGGVAGRFPAFEAVDLPLPCWKLEEWFFGCDCGSCTPEILGVGSFVPIPGRERTLEELSECRFLLERCLDP